MKIQVFEETFVISSREELQARLKTRRNGRWGASEQAIEAFLERFRTEKSRRGRLTGPTRKY